MNRKQWLKRVLILSALVIPTILYFVKVYSFLNLTRRVEPDILIVEGWLGEDALEAAKVEFQNKNYRLLLTTGFPYYDGWLMGSGGKMVFDLQNRVLNSGDNTYQVSLTIKGSKAQGEFAHFKLYGDTILLGQSHVTLHKKTYTFRFVRQTPPGIITVEFDNDLYAGLRDRNLIIYDVTVNDQVFPADNKSVSCYTGSVGEYYFRQTLSQSSAERAACYLIDAGIPDSLIVHVVTRKKNKSRTYSTGVDVKDWMAKNLEEDKHAITIITQGVHARRSYYLYRKVFGDQMDIGVISIPDRDLNYYNWWKYPAGWARVLYETFGLAYASFL